ncbi:hypothetical protein EZV62_006710 [Acer yangbiense]|uniref:Rad60/SUMO-like domain-containing protein n=1 Tax=Acer yangbiense TaxID=1000413 RepID=A0A5C7I8C6_9ROSI|nr:hypothetical protein EZV62_006710 [Acer yangbiense]
MSDAAMDPPPNPPPPVVKTEQAEKNNNPSSSNHITLRVKDQNENEVHFRIKKSAPLKMLMDGYCVKNRVELNTFAFLFDGNNLCPDQTPEQLKLFRSSLSIHTLLDIRFIELNFDIKISNL